MNRDNTGIALLLIVFVIALLIRLAWVVTRPALAVPASALAFPDEREYWRLAMSVAAGHGLVDEFGYRATYMPAYPAFLSLFVTAPNGLLLARVAQAVLGAAIVFPLFLLGLRIGGGRAAFAAAVLGAIDPFLVFGFSHLILTETLFATMLALGLALAWPGSGAPRSGMENVFAGLAFAAAVYLRPSAAVLAIAWPLVAGLCCARRERNLAAAIVPPAICMLLLLPWALRNRAVLGEWRWLTTRNGISLYDGLGPHAAGGSNLARTKTMPEVTNLNELQWNAFFAREAMRCATEDPGRVLRLAWTKLKRTWSLVPNEPGSRTPAKMAVSAAWMLLTLGAAVVGAARCRNRRVVALLLLPAVYFTILHMVYVGSVRYRVPAMPAIYVLSAAAFASARALQARRELRAVAAGGKHG